MYVCCVWYELSVWSVVCGVLWALSVVCVWACVGVHVVWYVFVWECGGVVCGVREKALLVP